MLKSAFINDFFPDQESNEGKYFNAKEAIVSKSCCFLSFFFLSGLS